MKPGDRVRHGRNHGTVLNTWRSPRGFDRPGEDFVRVRLDRGAAVTCRATELKLVQTKLPRADATSGRPAARQG